MPWALGAAGICVAASGWDGPGSWPSGEHWLRQSKKEGRKMRGFCIHLLTTEHVLVRAVFGGQ